MLDASMMLADGRSLAYTEVGASASPLVVYFHGAPGSRMDMVVFDDAFKALDVRVVSADRPGYGALQPRPDAGWRIGRRTWLRWLTISELTGLPS